MNKTIKRIIALSLSMFLLHTQLKPMETEGAAAAAAQPAGFSYLWGLSERQGRRLKMEDAATIATKNNFFAIYDGHGGRNAAEYAAKNLHMRLSQYIKEGKHPEESIIQAFEQTDREIQEKMPDGSTAMAAFIKDNRLYLAWVGDARAIVVRNGRAILATKDHKPDHPSELERIVAAGASVVRFTQNPTISTDKRIKVIVSPPSLISGDFIDRIFIKPIEKYEDIFGGVASLIPSRSLGDREFKKRIRGAIIATPEIISLELQIGDIIILACDGVWDKLSNEDAVQIVQQTIENPSTKILYQKGYPGEVLKAGGNNPLMKNIARNLRNEAFNKGSTDNISALVVKLGEPGITETRAAAVPPAAPEFEPAALPAATTKPEPHNPLMEDFIMMGAPEAAAAAAPVGKIFLENATTGRFVAQGWPLLISFTKNNQPIDKVLDPKMKISLGYINEIGPNIFYKTYGQLLGMLAGTYEIDITNIKANPSVSVMIPIISEHGYVKSIYSAQPPVELSPVQAAAIALPQITNPWQAFPRVISQINIEKIIQPHYVLNVTYDATAEKIEATYNDLVKEFRGTPYSFKDVILTIINDAHTVLVQQKEMLNKLDAALLRLSQLKPEESFTEEQKLEIQRKIQEKMSELSGIRLNVAGIFTNEKFLKPERMEDKVFKTWNTATISRYFVGINRILEEE